LASPFGQNELTYSLLTKWIIIQVAKIYIFFFTEKLSAFFIQKNISQIPQILSFMIKSQQIPPKTMQFLN